MKRLYLSIAILAVAPCFATHHTLTPNEKVEYAQKRIDLLRSQLDTARLQKKDIRTLEEELKIAQQSLAALGKPPAHEVHHQTSQSLQSKT